MLFIESTSFFHAVSTISSQAAVEEKSVAQSPAALHLPQRSQAAASQDMAERDAGRIPSTSNIDGMNLAAT